MKLLFVFFLASGLFSCGDTKPKTLGRKKEAKPVVNCPGTLPNSYHTVVLENLKSIPPKMALILEGVPEINECSPLEEVPPVVRFSRSSESSLTFVVEHAGAYSTPPKDISFRIFDLGDCKQSSRDYFVASKAPLNFQKEFPNGEKCPALKTATLTLSPNL